MYFMLVRDMIASFIHLIFDFSTCVFIIFVSFLLLITRNEALRVAFIHVEESVGAQGQVSREFYSKLVKADIHGKDQVYGVALYGRLILDHRHHIALMIIVEGKGSKLCFESEISLWCHFISHSSEQCLFIDYGYITFVKKMILEKLMCVLYMCRKYIPLNYQVIQSLVKGSLKTKTMQLSLLVVRLFKQLT